MDFNAKKNAAVQIKEIIEKAGKNGYRLLDNNPGNFILDVTRIDFDLEHVKKITAEGGGAEKAVEFALGEA
jgi:hypothetical protein